MKAHLRLNKRPFLTEIIETPKFVEFCFQKSTRKQKPKFRIIQASKTQKNRSVGDLNARTPASPSRKVP